MRAQGLTKGKGGGQEEAQAWEGGRPAVSRWRKRREAVLGGGGGGEWKKRPRVQVPWMRKRLGGGHQT